MPRQTLIFSRKHFISIRVSHSEKQMLKTRARRAHKRSLSSYVLDAALGRIKAR